MASQTLANKRQGQNGTWVVLGTIPPSWWYIWQKRHFHDSLADGHVMLANKEDACDGHVLSPKK